MDKKICDTCGKEISNKFFVFGDSWTGNYYDFCSYLCLVNFINNEIQKEEACAD